MSDSESEALGQPEEFSYHFPVNGVSFGQVSTCILRELKSRASDSPLNIFEIGKSDLSSQSENKDFENWLKASTSKAPSSHNRETPLVKLWHLYDHSTTLSSFSNSQRLITFHELDQLTPLEINIAKNVDRIFLTSEYSVKVFHDHGISNAEYLPLGFDHHNFSPSSKKYFDDDRITFNLVGKFEKRKNHKEAIQTWIKRFGNDNRYFLQCAVQNTFLKPEENQQIFSSLIGNQRVSNISFLTFMPKNSQYNDYLNSGDIIIGASGGEGWGLPEFHSVGLGKHAVIMDCTGYKSWANDSNCFLFESGEKQEVYDNVFFKKGNPYNQGNYFSFNSDGFIDACEKAIEKVRTSRVNEEGKKIQFEFTWSKTVDKLLKK
tara:strand:- start:422 stop:1549 length:1128 start_codon:yes stop_codon:yes gene_type:complete